MDPASARLLQLGFLGVLIGAALVAGLELRPVGILPAEGTLSVALSSSPADIEGPLPSCNDCSVTALNVTVDSVQVHTAGILNLKAGWVEALDRTTTFDLLETTKLAQIVASARVPHGAITSVRLRVTEATAVLSDGTVLPPLEVPSEHLMINLRKSGEVRAGLTTTIVLDVQPHIVCQGNGECRLTPDLGNARIIGPS